MKNFGNNKLWFVAAAVVVLVYIISVLFNVRQLWGYNLANFLPLWWQWLTIVLLLALSIPAISKRLWLQMGRASQAIVKSSYREWFFTITFIIVMLPLFIIFNSKGYFLGDATVRLNNIASGLLWIPTEPGDYFTHAITDRLILEPLGQKVALGYHIISTLCGAIFIVGTFRLAKYLRAEQTLQIFLLLFTSSMTVMFFGYIESYSIIAALIPFLFLLALKAIDGKSHVITFSILFIVAAFMHTLILFILPGLLLMVLILPRINVVQLRRLNTGLLFIIIVGVILAYLGYYLGSNFIVRHLLALYPTNESRMGFFTLNHLWNIINWIGLAGLTGAFLLITTLLGKPTTTNQNIKHKSLVLWIIIPPIMFMLFFKPHLGGPRDWDLYAPMAFVLIPASIIYYFSRFKRALPPVLLPVLGISLFTMVSFATVNSSVVRAADRFCEIIEVSKFKNLFKEYGMLFEFAKNTPELNHRILEFGLKAWEQPAYNKSDSVFMAKRLAQIYMDKRDRNNAYNFLNLALQADSADLETYFQFNEFCRFFNETSQLPQLAESMAQNLPNNHQALLSAGMTFQEFGENERAGELFNRAYQIKPDDPLTILNLGKYKYDVGDYQNCITLLDHIKQTDPFAFYAFYYKANAWYRLGNSEKAVENLDIAARLAKSRDEKEMAIALKQLLNLQ
jgi:hypothetical protein